MFSKSELRKRQWPDPVRDVAVGGSSNHIREGRMFTRPLQMSRGIAEPIPPGECAITSLVTDGSAVFGATSGVRSHLFCYFGGAQSDGVYDVGVVPGARAVRNCLVVGADGEILGGISEAEDGNKGGGLFRPAGFHHFRRRSGKKRPHHHHHHRRRMSMRDGWPRQPEIELLPAPVPGECVAAMAVSPDRTTAYGLSSESATFFAADMASAEVTIKGRATEDPNYSHVLVADRRGRIYGAGPLGELFRFDPATDQIDTLPVSLPTVAGRDFYNRMDSAALDPATGLIYGGGSADGVIFVLDPKEMTMRSLGKVIAEPRCRCITVGLDGRVYGVAGEPDGMGHLFCYDPGTHELRDLGIPCAGSERAWHGYEFAAACTGRNGEIYLGESDRISHLFMYFPPIRPAANGAAPPAV